MGRAQEQIRAQMKEIDDLKEELGGTERALQQARDRLDEMQAEPPSQRDQDPSLVTQISDLHDTIEEKEAQLSDARSTVLEQLQELSRVKSNLDQSSTDAKDLKAQFESKRVALEAEERHSANLKQMLLETQRKLSLGQPQQDQSGDGAHPRRDDTHRPYRPDNRGWRDRSDCYGPRRERNSERPYPQSQSALSDEEMGTKAKSDPPQKGSGSKGGSKGESKSSDLTEEECKLLRQIIRRIQRKGDKKADLFSVAVTAVQDDTFEPNMMPVQQTAVQEDVCMSLQESVTPSPADTPVDLEPQDNTSQETTSTSAVLVVQANSTEEPAEEDSSLIRLEPPFLQFLCKLTEKGIAQKFYVNTVLENELQHEALLDTAADITLMSSTLFNRLRNMVQQSNRDIKLQPCAMEIRPYSTDTISRELYDALSRDDPNLQCVRKAFRFPLDSLPKATMTAEGVCALTVRWNKREMTHHFLVIPDLPHQVYMGSDILVREDTSEDVLIPKSTPLGWLISTSFHDFELRIPVIGKMPRSLMSDHSPEQVFHTLPSRAISLFPTVPLDHDTICQVDLSEDSQMVLHQVQVLNVSSEPEMAHTLSGVEPSIFPTGQTPEHDPDFDAKVEQLVAEADALNGEEEREKLRKLLHKYRASFAKDSLDCGLTSIHSIRIPTPPDAPPTFLTNAGAKISLSKCQWCRTKVNYVGLLVGPTDCNRPFYLEVGFSCHCLSAGLYQIHNTDKRVVACASKTLLAPELKFSDCEKRFSPRQRIRDGVVTNARVASWLMAFQSFDIEVHYAQNRKTPLGMELAACQSCLTDSADTGSPTCDPEPPELSCHRYFDDNVCKDMITAYVDGCSYHHDTVLRAGVGVVWVNDNHSNYARLSFSCHQPLWKRNGFLTSNRKPVKHKDLFLACDFLTSNHDLQIYWKKVRGHSRIPGPDKTFNDQADSLAKQGALTGSDWHFEPSVFPLPPVPLVCAVTRAQSRAPPRLAPSGPVSATVAPAFSDSDLLALQASDPAIVAMTQFLSGPPDSSMPPDLFDSIPGLHHLFRVRSLLWLVKGFLIYVSDALTSPALVVPRSHRG
ncbi:hypothetical protein LDENG_00238730%2C partial [Xyrichtys novacula]|uniref:RNase H type-1 domain-containing protein n=1 Tax=Xyrichtys novacula TaxID=13765 RepID=A0AAV1H6C0_XYRNO|nr:hypothetical protein LDENG_00238730%2C partial [Xyrichtys novacula]